ncbi:MAG: GC-type dockerin domain-anchored protein [Phycisphaerales bacterium]
MRSSAQTYLLLVLGLSWSAFAAGQGFVAPDGYGWERTDAMATHHEWDDFVSASGDNAPDIAASPAVVPGSATQPTVVETSGGAFLTTTGNIYSINAIVSFLVEVPTFTEPGGTTEVLLQTRTQGREIDPLTITANGVAPVEVVELYRLVLGPDDIFGGSLVDALWRFEVPNASSVTIEFEAEDTSMSLDRLSVDTVAREASCRADLNGNGVADPGDFTAWVAAYNASDPAADQNGDGLVNPSDFSAWVANFNLGCGG